VRTARPITYFKGRANYMRGPTPMDFRLLVNIFTPVDPFSA